MTLPVDTTRPPAPAVSVTGTTSSTLDLAWGPVADDDSSCCTYRVFADGALVSIDNLHWTGERAVTVLRLAAATTHSLSVVAVDPSRNASAPSAPVTATTPPSSDTAGPSAPGNLYAFNFGCETWLFWDQSVDDVDPQSAIRYEVFVNGVSDGGQNAIDRWITYGTQTPSNTYTVEAVDSAGNRSPVSSVRSTTRPAEGRGAGEGRAGATRSGAPYSRFIMASASRSRSTYSSPETSTTASLIVPPVNA